MAVMGIALGMAACTQKEDPTDEPETPAEKVVAGFTYSVDGLNVTFTNTSTGAASYKWDFGDDETSKEASPKHTYAASGEYTVKLTAANADGVVNKTEQTVTVAGAVKAYFSYTAVDGRKGKFGKVLSFDATASENASSIAWDFGDGQSASEFKVDHEFPDYGKYTVKATVTGANGSTDTYEAAVETVANNELLKGGEMNEGDEQYWTIEAIYAPLAESYEELQDGKYCWQPYFGYTDDKPSAGVGGCLRLSSENQTHDWANNFRMYQAIEVEAGDVLRVSADMKWGERTNNNGLLWFGLAEEGNIGADGTAVMEIFNYWGDQTGDPVPAYDGNFAGTEEWLKANTAMGLGYSGDGETPYVDYTVETSGTLYFYLDYRSVWGPIFGPGIDLYFDNLSVKVIL